VTGCNLHLVTRWEWRQYVFWILYLPIRLQSLRKNMEHAPWQHHAVFRTLRVSSSSSPPPPPPPPPRILIIILRHFSCEIYALYPMSLFFSVFSWDRYFFRVSSSESNNFALFCISRKSCPSANLVGSNIDCVSKQVRTLKQIPAFSSVTDISSQFLIYFVHV
jgi:hypothetical protein